MTPAQALFDSRGNGGETENFLMKAYHNFVSALSHVQKRRLSTSDLKVPSLNQLHQQNRGDLPVRRNGGGRVKPAPLPLKIYYSFQE